MNKTIFLNNLKQRIEYSNKFRYILYIITFIIIDIISIIFYIINYKYIKYNIKYNNDISYNIFMIFISICILYNTYKYNKYINIINKLSYDYTNKFFIYLEDNIDKNDNLEVQQCLSYLGPFNKEYFLDYNDIGLIIDVLEASKKEIVYNLINMTYDEKGDNN